jgi:serine/threonine-protein kinase
MTDTRPSVAARPDRTAGGRPGGAAIAALVAGLAVLTLVIGGCGSTAQGSGQPAGGAPSSAAPAPAPPAAPSATTPATAASPDLARVFPSATEPTCRAAGSQDQLTTSNGSAPLDATVCDYSRVAPGALVIFARWSDTAAAQSFYNDTANLGPRIENFDVWQSNGVQQGPLYTAQSEGRVISTGLYTGLPYSWEIRTATLEQSNAVFGQVRFRPRSELGG